MSNLRAVNFFSSVLRNCVNRSVISLAKQTHTQILVNGPLHDVTLYTDMLLAYCRCGLLEYARKVFDKMPCRNMHSWNIMIASYVQNSMYYDALSVFCRFMEVGLRPDYYTLPPVFRACASTCDSTLGAILHGWVIKVGFKDYVVLGSSILEFYLKCRSLTEVKLVFGDIMWKDSVVWNLIISGFSRAELSLDALNYFRGMLEERMKMDHMVIPSVLNACGKEGDTMKGKEIHGKIVKCVAFNNDIAIMNALIDMYSKVGLLSSSEMIFQNIKFPNLISWTTMISCYGVHGRGEEALVLFEKMKDRGFSPNSITITAILSSCSHSGLIDHGRRIFKSIISDYGIEPNSEHYGCMVDLLSRFGCLEEALFLIRTMRFVPQASVWGALLSGSVLHKNVVIGELAADHLFQLEPKNSSNYVAMLSIYESLGMWNSVSKIRRKMRDLDLAKTPGCSWITIGGIPHKFYQGNLSHPYTKLMYETLHGLLRTQIFTEVF